MKQTHTRPGDIERTSMALIEEELAARGVAVPEETAAVVKRVIHTTADFSYADSLYFSPGAVEAAKAAIKGGATIVTDTQMAMAGINKRAAEGFGCRVVCFMSDPDVALEAKAQGFTRARVSVDRAAAMGGSLIFAVGNAPTALIRLGELMEKGMPAPRLIIGAPVGFVNVEGAKELIIQSGAPCIVARGRRGGSGVAAAICNALLYTAAGQLDPGKRGW